MDESGEDLQEPVVVNDHTPTLKPKSVQSKPIGDISKDVYAAAAECLDAVVKQRASVNSAIFNSPFQDKRFLLAITQKTIDNLQHVKRIVYDAKILELEPRLTKSMAYVIAFDMLFGEMREPRGVARLMGKFSDELKACLAKYLTEKKVKDVRELRTQSSKISNYPRYVRVNTLKATTDEVISSLEKEQFSLVDYEENDISQHTYLKKLRHFKPNHFFRDFHVPDLLVFHPTVFFHEHQLETSGKVILQDKASCLPSLLLNPPPGSTVIDACAAPGMKTSHLAALMGNEGKIYALDIHEARSKTMEGRLKHFDVTCAEVVNVDFLKITPDDEKYSGATHILVDPTCTGSGVTSRQIVQKDKKKATKKSKEEDKQRLQKLKGLQVTLLKHALSFPNVQRVVYSTCSVNPEEDEEVVQEAINSFASQFVVRPYSKYLPKWKGCGKPRYSVGRNCLRSFPEKHRTNGFFVAVIERFTPADAEAAQNGIGESATVDDGEEQEAELGDAKNASVKALEVGKGKDVKEKSKPTVEDVADGTAPSSGRKNRRRKKRVHEEVTERWSAGDSNSNKKQKG